MTSGSTGAPERFDPPGMHDGLHMDATEAFVIISDLKAEVARLKTLAESEYGRGFTDGTRCAECIKVFACDDCQHRRSNA